VHGITAPVGEPVCAAWPQFLPTRSKEPLLRHGTTLQAAGGGSGARHRVEAMEAMGLATTDAAAFLTTLRSAVGSGAVRDTVWAAVAAIEVLQAKHPHTLHQLVYVGPCHPRRTAVLVPRVCFLFSPHPSTCDLVVLLELSIITNGPHL